MSEQPLQPVDKPATQYPWWKADGKTWVPTSGVPIKVDDMTPEHIAGVLKHFARLLEPENLERLRWQMDARYINTLSPDHGACDDGAENFSRWITGMDAWPEGGEAVATPWEVVCTAYPAATAIVRRAKKLRIDLPDSVKEALP